MNTIIIDDEVYTIMKRSEYVDVCQAFINDGIERERLSRVRTDAVIMSALKFYAGKHNYLPNVSDVPLVDLENGIRQQDLSDVLVDGGNKARDAIALSDHHFGSIDVSGNVPVQCVMSNETVVVMAHSDDDNRFMLDMKFDGLDDPVKLILIVDDAYSVIDVLNEFIACSAHGQRIGRKNDE